MTIEEMKELKIETEGKINQILLEFQETTGLKIEDINITHVYLINKDQPIEYNINLDIKI